MSRRDSRVNREWQTPDPGFTWEHVAIEVLMDIRDELRHVNRTLRCPNVAGGLIAMQRLEKFMRNRYKKKPKPKVSK